MSVSHSRVLQQLAGLYGVQTAYDDTSGRRQHADPQSLLAALRLLGAPVASFSDAPMALRERRQALWQRGIEPVVVGWDGALSHVECRLPQALASGYMSACLRIEHGEVHRWDVKPSHLTTLNTTDVEGVPYLTQHVALPVALPLGYHHLTLSSADRTFKTLLISAPKRAYHSPDEEARRRWGVFVPLYALHAERSWGGGDFSDLAALIDWTVAQGGRVVGTLPLLSAFLDTPYDPSPYAPASRLFWNELYIDVTQAPGLAACAGARDLLLNAEQQASLASLRSAPLLDYRRQMALKRPLLNALAQWFFAGPATSHSAFQAYLRTHPSVADYACFRAVGERQRAPWTVWPQPLRDGEITEADYDPEDRHYHLYVQWVAHEQLNAAVHRGRDAGVQLYLDLPLGVHAQSYDTWRERTLFARDASAGAPPDSVFTRGQSWGFPPLHPEAIRQQGYRYCIAYLRHQMRHAGLLRIDHVMGLHRLFWIPPGLAPHQGVFVRYAAEELYAILNLESHRQQTSLVGENLGTVPGYVNSAMARHHLHRMYVVQYELAPGPKGGLTPVPQHAVASLNTHDMPTFMAFWQGLDIGDRLAQGLLDAEQAAQAQRDRQLQMQILQQSLQHQGFLDELTDDAQVVLSACLAYLAASPCQTVLVNLEDLWLEPEPQNVPNTGQERPNWQRKTRYPLETWRHLPQVQEVLQRINERRNQGVNLL